MSLALFGFIVFVKLHVSIVCVKYRREHTALYHDNEFLCALATLLLVLLLVTVGFCDDGFQCEAQHCQATRFRWLTDSTP